jgi:hypothetical protein
MISSQIVHVEAGQYQALASQLRTDFADIDDETLADTLEGLSDLPNLLCTVIRSSLEDEALIAALKDRISDMRACLGRLEARHQRKRELVCGAMSRAGMEKFGAEDFSVSLRQGLPRISCPRPHPGQGGRNTDRPRGYRLGGGFGPESL